MDKIFGTVLLLVLLCFRELKAETKLTCIQQDPCGCRINEFEKLDISNLIGDQKFLKDTDNNLTYYFFGCKDVNVNSTVIGFNITKSYNGSLFLYNETLSKANATPTFDIVGFAKDIKYDLLDGNFEMHYKSDKLSATLILICDNLKIPFIKILDTKENIPTIALSSPHACIIKEPHGYSTGSILVILFIVTCIIYFIGGGLILYFLRGARGIELIPNIDFWKTLPGLIKDGLVFLLSGCRVSSIETYDRI